MVISVPQCDSMYLPEQSTMCLTHYDVSFFSATSAEWGGETVVKLIFNYTRQLILCQFVVQLHRC